MPPLSAGSTYLLIKAGILPYLNGVQVPWTTPPVVSGFLIGGWKVAIWQAMILVVSFFVYLPFVRSYDKMLYEKEQAKVTEEKSLNKIVIKKIDDHRFLTKIIDLLFFYNPNAILYNNAPQIPPAIGATTGTQP